jgi:hypothetical protein
VFDKKIEKQMTEEILDFSYSSFLISSVHHYGTAAWGPSCWVLWIADAKKLKEQVIYCEEYL